MGEGVENRPDRGNVKLVEVTWLLSVDEKPKEKEMENCWKFSNFCSAFPSENTHKVAVLPGS